MKKQDQLIRDLLGAMGLQRVADAGSWGRVLHFQRRLQQGEFGELAAGEASWMLHKGAYHSPLTPETYHAPEAGNTLSRAGDCAAELFRSFLDEGIVPPPEVLLALKESLDLYHASSGEISLESAVYAPRVRGAGSADEAAENSAIYELFELWINGREGPQEDLAEKFLLDIESDKEADVFLRGYRRWRRKAVNK